MQSPQERTACSGDLEDCMVRKTWRTGAGKGVVDRPLRGPEVTRPEGAESEGAPRAGSPGKAIEDDIPERVCRPRPPGRVGGGVPLHRKRWRDEEQEAIGAWRRMDRRPVRGAPFGGLPNTPSADASQGSERFTLTDSQGHGQREGRELKVAVGTPLGS